MTSLELVPYDPEYKAEIAGLLKLLLSPDVAANRRYLEWKYEENPYFPEPGLHLVRASGRIVGMRGVYGTCWEAGDRSPIVLPYPDDHVVAEDHRGSGVATLLMRAVLDDAAARGHPFMVNLSAGLVTALASLAAGWKRVGAAEPVTRVAPPSGLARWTARLGRHSERIKRFMAGRGWGTSSADAFVRLDRIGEGDGDGGTYSVASHPRVLEMAALVDRLGHDGRIRHVRDAAFLNWRYRHPLHEYRFLYHDRAGQSTGYLVLRRYRSARHVRGRADIVDWEAGDEQVAAGLLARAIEWGSFSDLRSWTVTLPEARTRLLAESGFVVGEEDRRNRGTPGILVRATGDADSDWILSDRPLLDAAQWDVRQIFSMQG